MAVFPEKLHLAFGPVFQGNLRYPVNYEIRVVPGVTVKVFEPLWFEHVEVIHIPSGILWSLI